MPVERAFEFYGEARNLEALPLGPLGELAHAAFVRRDLQRIFDYRARAVAERLTSA